MACPSPKFPKPLTSFMSTSQKSRTSMVIKGSAPKKLPTTNVNSAMEAGINSDFESEWTAVALEPLSLPTDLFSRSVELMNDAEDFSDATYAREPLLSNPKAVPIPIPDLAASAASGTFKRCLFDSGATSHMCPDRNMFVSFRETAPNRIQGASSAFDSTGIGEILLEVPTEFRKSKL